MKSYKLRTAGNKIYSLAVDEQSFKKESVNNWTEWSVEHKVLDENDRQIGFGHLKIRCRSNHEHMDDNKIYDGLVWFGGGRIIDNIEKGESLESVGYFITTEDCQA